MASAKTATTQKAAPKAKAPKETSDPAHRQVRLKDYKPKAGHVLQRYTYRGIKFESGKGFYRVPLSVATYLKGVRNVADDPHSPLAFDVFTLEEAKAAVDGEFAAKVNGGRVMPGDSPVLKPRETEQDLRPGSDGRAPTEAELVTADLRRREETPSGDRQTRPA